MTIRQNILAFLKGMRNWMKNLQMKDQKKSKYYKNMLNSLRKDLIYNKKMNSYTVN